MKLQPFYRMNTQGEPQMSDSLLSPQNFGQSEYQQDYSSPGLADNPYQYQMDGYQYNYQNYNCGAGLVGNPNPGAGLLGNPYLVPSLVENPYYYYVSTVCVPGCYHLLYPVVGAFPIFCTKNPIVLIRFYSMTRIFSSNAQLAVWLNYTEMEKFVKGFTNRLKHG